MANQYQNFSNPTIVPDQKYGWQARQQSVQGLSDYLSNRGAQGQGLQLEQAKQLANAQAMSIAYTGQRNPNIDSMLSQNPFGRFLMPQGNQKTSGTPQPGNNVISSTLMGVSPQSAMFGSGGNVTPMGGSGLQPADNTTDGSKSMSANFSPFNPISSGPVVTSQTNEFQPYVGMVPKSITTQNPQGEATVAGAKEYATKNVGNQVAANEGVSRDIQQLGMVKNAIKPLVDSYNQVYNQKVMGMPAAGDIYGSSLVKNADKIPRAFDLQKKAVPDDVQNAAGQFLANKNELIVKLQPLLSQQFGKDGSSRIMEKLVDMSKQEIGDLSTPKDQFHGQISGTISSLYRIAKASQAYSKDLAQSGQPMPDPDTAAQEISRRMAFQTLSPMEDKELKGMINDVLGKNQKSLTPQDGNPVAQAKGNTPQQSTQAKTQTFIVGGKTYNIPSDKVEAFKKAKGIK